MIVDASAVLAIVFGEPDLEAFLTAITAAPTCSISAGTFLEISMVAQSRGGDKAILRCDTFLREASISILPFTPEHAYIARQAFSDYGKGRHPACLNFGDCFSYALAKATGEPLLFKGDDFRKTDVLPALA
jgi:ribonuclease VapC